MSLPANKLYLCWSESVPFEDCHSIVQVFADDNFTEVVNSKIWHEEGDHTLTCMCVAFSHLIYKIQCDTLTYNDRIHRITPEYNKPGSALNVHKYRIYYRGPANDVEYMSTFRSLRAYNHISGSHDEGTVFWVVDNTGTDAVFYDANRSYRKKYDNPYKIPVSIKGCYVLHLTDVRVGNMYSYLNRIIACGSSVLVISTWTPRLPMLVNDRRWCFAKIDDGGMKYEHFIPERVSRAKSARK